nr:GNAT family N-acetyltransferase [Hymenobacter sp. AT01-02]
MPQLPTPGPYPLALVPALETTDLLLRDHRPTDLADYAAIGVEPAFYRFLGGKPQSEEEVWRRILGQQGHWAIMGYGYWAVEEKATGRFIGAVGFANYHRDMMPSLGDAPEVGWVLAPRVHGLATPAKRCKRCWPGATPTSRKIGPSASSTPTIPHLCGWRQSLATTNTPALPTKRNSLCC